MEKESDIFYLRKQSINTQSRENVVSQNFVKYTTVELSTALKNNAIDYFIDSHANGYDKKLESSKESDAEPFTEVKTKSRRRKLLEYECTDEILNAVCPEKDLKIFCPM
ncbi:hypothetical protein CEXT_50241 [Caerostris extrusa]|uniref:Uncharacterized protein n=1 Tax=Caerostris extrusa TaxID=172846 RepID=A0AAV4NDH1_CAEEX|nr:hypothetical protein CEXT_50241 [Caerostris extrusa]